MKKILTLMLEGFGIREDEFGNAIKQANMPNFKKLWESYPHSLLKASEESLGLLENQSGNCELGHLTVGAGRKIKNSATLANDFFEGLYEDNVTFMTLLSNKDARVHLLFLISDGKVNSSMNDIKNVYNLLVKNGFSNIYFHLITDGVDSQNFTCENYIKEIESLISKNKVGIISTIAGRDYALDSLSNYNKTKIYYDLIAFGRGISVINIHKGISNCYSKGTNDYDLRPMVINYDGLIKDGDTILWMNYNTENSKQILSALANPNFDMFPTKDYSSLYVYSIFSQDKKLKINSFIERDLVSQPLGLYLSELELTQARIASSNRILHVTSFFDGYYKGKILNCDKFEIKPNLELTFNKALETSTLDISKRIIKCMEKDYDFILANYSCVDECAHANNFENTIQMLEFLDKCLGIIIKAAEDNFYKVVVLSDHGNADSMLDELGEANNYNTTSEVPFIITDNHICLEKKGDLTMVAPTILNYMDIAIPKAMQDTPILIKE